MQGLAEVVAVFMGIINKSSSESCILQLYFQDNSEMDWDRA